MTESSLGYVYVCFPGKASWEMFYVILKDSEMHFTPSVRHHAPTHTYIINRIMMRRSKKYIAVPDKSGNGQVSLQKKDVLLITHEYDTNCLFLTAPIIFDTPHAYPEFRTTILEKYTERIENFSKLEPEIVSTVMNHTNRYSWGKVFVWVNKIINFPYFNSIFVRLSIQPWSLSTKRIMDSKFEFKQGFYIPVANYFFTLKVEIINLENTGFFREKFEEHIIESYEIRLPDLNKDPFQRDGTLVLPIKPIQDYRKLGLKLPEDIQGAPGSSTNQTAGGNSAGNSALNQ